MTVSDKLRLIFVAAAFMAAATACFTGIESTPKITADNVRDSGVRVTDEQTFSAEIVAEAPRAWKMGKQWLVSDSKIALAFTPASDDASDLVGKTVSYVESRPVTTLTGDEVVELVLTDAAGRVFFHRTGIPVRDWEERLSYSIPFTVEMSAVERADSLMRGKTYYITTPRWFDQDGHDITGQRHIPVTVQTVEAGNHIYPLRVAFTQNERPQEPVRYILMTYGTSTASTRNFDRLFSFTNPRNSYPHITDATWEKIINSQIAEGMSRDECRLALGAPAKVDRGATPGMQLERWSYENGVYLLFEDGYLTKFRM